MDRQVLTPSSLVLAGDLTGECESETKFSSNDGVRAGAAIGPLASGFLVAFGFVWPFAFGAVLAVLGLALVYTQVEETVADPTMPEVVAQD